SAPRRRSSIWSSKAFTVVTAGANQMHSPVSGCGSGLAEPPLFRALLGGAKRLTQFEHTFIRQRSLGCCAEIRGDVFGIRRAHNRAVDSWFGERESQGNLRPEVLLIAVKPQLGR